ncbi:BatA domain-containing protein [Lignipirellula cremea]|uniref:VWFA domain-containing protein n=1 Tax=Lignipirellula cremea TaxID=2528010 RepID=A0A518DX94_9BACT|nr:BatA domain-containing protein [Lignipirellula cremea]QDU96455.1 hypothetical protein Pla8534_42760 [Lignipirellula cremea]
MLESIGAWFGGWLLSPWLLGLGAALMASPILIHLLNRRKFRVVDWAAMDFLLEADRRNRRRVQLENLLLLLLRCLAMLLLGLMLARPFSCQFAPGLFEAQRFERIVLFDDSLSMQVVSGNQTTLDRAKEELKSLVRGLADNDSEDSLTVLLASRPSERLLNAAPIQSSDDDLIKLFKAIDEIEASDRAAQLTAGLLEIEELIAGESKNVNRVAYLLSDMRRRDWRLDDPQDDNPPALLKRLADTVSACLVIDVGSADDPAANLAVAAIAPEDTLIGGVATQFQVTVANPSDTEARDVAVELSVGEGLPMVRTIDRIAPGAMATEPFLFKLPLLIDADSTPVRIRASVIAASPAQDRLAADSERFYAGTVVRGVPTLLVDGAPSSIPHRAESYYLQKALEPPGDLLSGVSAEIVTDTQFESMSLDRFQVIFLCNVYRLSEQRCQSLRAWVQAGGGLMILPGDQVDERDFNKHFAEGADPLSPLRLMRLAGDETAAVWSQLQVDAPQHPALKEFGGQNNPLIDSVKIFRWWKTEVAVPSDTAAADAPPVDPQPVAAADDATVAQGAAVVLARVGEEGDVTPAIAEKRFGRGRVAMMAMPADADWSDWASYPSFLIAMQEFTQYLADDAGVRRELAVGETLRQTIDLTRSQRIGTLTLPGGAQASIQAEESAGRPAPAGESPDSQENAADDTPSAARENEADIQAPSVPLWEIVYDAVDQRGYYELRLPQNQGGEQSYLFAANVDPTESDLRRVDLVQLEQQLDHPRIVLLAAGGASQTAVSGKQNEWWRRTLYLLLGVLFAEQGLAWFFGRRR